MRRATVLAVARLELGELWRDPQVAWAIAGMVALAHGLVVAGGAEGPGDVIEGFTLIAPVGLLFLAGPRKGAAQETAFRRLARTAPLAEDEWIAGRALGLLALAGVYAALVAPALLIVVSSSGTPLVVAIDVVASLAGLSAIAILLGLALRGHPTPVALALAALGAIVSYRLTAIPFLFPPGVAAQVASVLAAALPGTQLKLAGAVAQGVDAPTWAIGAALAGTLALAVALAFRRRRAWAVGAWLAGAIALGATIHARRSPIMDFDAGPPTGLEQLLPYLIVLAAIPAAMAWLRGRTVGS